MQQRIAERLRSDDGFGLVEIVISMFMLAILAMLFLPLLIQGLKQSAANTTLATATMLVNEQVRLAHTKSPICTDVEQLEKTDTFDDPRDVPIEITTIVGECPAGDGTVSVTVEAVHGETDQVLTSAATLVLVKAP